MNWTFQISLVEFTRYFMFLCLKVYRDTVSIIPLKGLGVEDIISYEEVLVEILDRKVKRLKNREVASIKILWKNHLVEGAT